jgi:segregation and condensation protein B
MNKKIAELEALLFIHGEPISFKKIESVLKLAPGECEGLIQEMRKTLENDGRGLQLVVGGGTVAGGSPGGAGDGDAGKKVQLATKPEFNTILENFVREELSEDLTPASLEALSIIAYLGPISRAKLEYLRGVNSLIILRSLMIRGLVERIPDPAHPSGFLYQPTFDLMKQLGLQSKEDLPEFAKFQALLKVFETQNASEEKIPHAQ